ncbi:MAG: hypothetical protein R3C28_24795 [Pirellulaceae bacterium]
MTESFPAADNGVIAADGRIDGSGDFQQVIRIFGDVTVIAQNQTPGPVVMSSSKSPPTTALLPPSSVMMSWPPPVV